MPVPLVRAFLLLYVICHFIIYCYKNYILKTNKLFKVIIGRYDYIY